MMEQQRVKESLKTTNSPNVSRRASGGVSSHRSSRFVYASRPSAESRWVLQPDYSLSLRDVFNHPPGHSSNSSRSSSVGLASGVEYSSARDLPSWAVEWSGEGLTVALCNPNDGTASGSLAAWDTNPTHLRQSSAVSESTCRS